MSIFTIQISVLLVQFVKYCYFFRTDFYYVPEGAYENMGFPPGVAEELVIKVLRTCDPKNWKGTNGARKPDNVEHEIMCSTVAQEVEVEAENDPDESEEESQEPTVRQCSVSQDHDYTAKPSASNKETKPEPKLNLDDYEPPVIPVQKNSESYNGAVRDEYSWSQSITELGTCFNLFKL